MSRIVVFNIIKLLPIFQLFDIIINKKILQKNHGGNFMYIAKLCVQNFRNLKKQCIQFSPKLNVLVGNNGMGKTNILESIYFLSIGRSPRAVKDTECIAFDQTRADISLEFVRNSVLRGITLTLDKQKNKALSLDGVVAKKLSEIVGHFGSVYFSPQELQIVGGSPSMRRRFVDIINCQISPQYLEELSRYQHAIKQRNNILKKLKSNEYTLELESWDTQISKLFATITKKRKMFVDQLNEVSAQIHKKLTKDQEVLVVRYDSAVEEVGDFDSLCNAFMQKTKENFEKDRILQYTTFGCHNDDLELRLQCFENNKISKTLNLKKNGSQGQQRTAVLSLILAEVEMLKNEYGEPPVLLLDDVLGELDENRQQNLMEFCKDFQTIITCTSWDKNVEAKVFDVFEGKVKEKTKN